MAIITIFNVLEQEVRTERYSGLAGSDIINVDVAGRGNLTLHDYQRTPLMNVQILAGIFRIIASTGIPADPDCVCVTQAQRAALDAANSPTGSNAVATMADLASLNTTGVTAYLVGTDIGDPYTSIQSAINQAAADMIAGTVTKPVVLVKPGTYIEMVTLRANIHVQALCPSKGTGITILQGNLQTYASMNGSAIWGGIDVISAGSNPALYITTDVTKTVNLYVYDCKITSYSGPPAVSQNSATHNIHARNVWFHRTGTGIIGWFQRGTHTFHDVNFTVDTPPPQSLSFKDCSVQWLRGYFTGQMTFAGNSCSGSIHHVSFDNNTAIALQANQSSGIWALYGCTKMGSGAWKTGNGSVTWAALTPDEEAAIHGAASPSATNVFATMADILDELTADEKAAIHGANAPSASNVFATIADLEEVDITRYIVGKEAADPYSSIQTAIDQAVTDGHGTANPAVVVVKPGVYSENITMQSGIIVRSNATINGGETTVLAGTLTMTATGTHVWSGIDIQNTSASTAVNIGGTGIIKVRLYHLRITQGSVNPAIAVSNSSVNSEISLVDVGASVPNFTTCMTISDDGPVYMFNVRLTNGTTTFPALSLTNAANIALAECLSLNGHLTAAGTATVNIHQLLVQSSSADGVIWDSTGVGKFSGYGYTGSGSAFSGTQVALCTLYDVDILPGITGVTAAQKAALDASNNPGASNAYVTFADMPTDYVVGPAGSGAPYTTIQGAIDQALADGANPALILVKPGTYSENVVLNDGNVVTSVYGEKAPAGVTTLDGTVTFDPSGTAEAAWIGIDVSKTTGGISIDGTANIVNFHLYNTRITVNKAGSPGLEILNQSSSSKVVVRDVQIENQNAAGVAIQTGALCAVELSGSHIRALTLNTLAALDVNGATVLKIDDIYLYGGIDLSGTSSGRLTGIVCDVNTVDAIVMTSSGTLRVGSVQLILAGGSVAVSGAQAANVTFIDYHPYMMTSSEKDAADNASSPSSTNPFVTANQINTPFTVSPPTGPGAYNTIQGAIDAAVAAGYGTTLPPIEVVVHAGTYTEDVTMANDVSLIGLSGPAGSAPQIDGNVTITNTSGSQQVYCMENIRVAEGSDNHAALLISGTAQVSFLARNCQFVNTAVASVACVVTVLNSSTLSTYQFENCTMLSHTDSNSSCVLLSYGTHTFKDCEVTSNGTLPSLTAFNDADVTVIDFTAHVGHLSWHSTGTLTVLRAYIGNSTSYPAIDALAGTVNAAHVAIGNKVVSSGTTDSMTGVTWMDEFSPVCYPKQDDVLVLGPWRVPAEGYYNDAKTCIEAGTDGDTIVVMPGKYIISASTEIPDGVNLRGMGWESGLYVVSGGGGPILTMGDNELHDLKIRLITYAGTSCMLHIRANDEGDDAAPKNGLFHCEIAILGGQSQSITFGADTSVIFKDCYIHGSSTASWVSNLSSPSVSGGGVLFENCKFRMTGEAQNDHLFKAVKLLTFRGCEFVVRQSSDSHAVFNMDGLCKFYDCFLGAVSGQSVYRITSVTGMDIPTYMDGFLCQELTQTPIMSLAAANLRRVVLLHGKLDIAVDTNLSYLFTTTIQNCYVVSNSGPALAFAAYSASIQALVQGCYFKAPTAEAGNGVVEFDDPSNLGPTNILVLGNHFEGAGSPAAGYALVVDTADSMTVDVSGNSYRNTTAGATAGGTNSLSTIT